MKKWSLLLYAIAALESFGASESGQLEASSPLLPLPSQQLATANGLGSAESMWPGWALGSAAPAWAGPFDGGSPCLASNFTPCDAAPHPVFISAESLCVHGCRCSEGRREQGGPSAGLRSPPLPQPGKEVTGSAHIAGFTLQDSTGPLRYSLRLGPPAQMEVGSLAEGQTDRQGNYPRSCPQSCHSLPSSLLWMSAKLRGKCSWAQGTSTL